VMPSSNFTCVLWAKLLKPCNSSSEMYICYKITDSGVKTEQSLKILASG
jgi:hypothetical protein